MENISTTEYAKRVRLLKINELENLISLKENALKYFPNISSNVDMIILLTKTKIELIEEIANLKDKLQLIQI